MSTTAGRPAAFLLLVVAVSAGAGFLGGRFGARPSAIPAEPSSSHPEAPPAGPTAAVAPAADAWDGADREHDLAPDEHLDLELTLPPHTCYLRLDAEADDGRDIDLRVAADRAAAARGEWAHSSTTYEAIEWIVLGRNREPLLAQQRLWVRVENRDRDAARVHLRAAIASGPTARPLAIDGDAQAVVREADGFRSVWTVEVPADATAVRFDLSDAAADVDLYVAQGPPPDDLADCAWRAETMAAAERLVLTDASEPPLRPGSTLSAIVLAPDFELEELPVRLWVTRGQDAPLPLRERRPEPPTADTPARRAIAACVAIAAGNGTGSGMVVRPDGLVLTAAHVVAEVGNGEQAIVIAMTRDPRRYPEEMFRGAVVARDEDLDVALVQITGTLYGQLPDDFGPLPTVPVAFDHDLEVGDPVNTVGYPGIGGSSTQVTISWSRGVLVGFAPDPTAGLMLKTDAMVAAGNSGGGLLDQELRLCGIAVATIDEQDGNGHLGYALPIGQLPHSWRQRISVQRARLDNR